MTIEKLLQCSAAQLKAMSDEQLLEYFKDKLNIVRPNLEARVATEEDTVENKKETRNRKRKSDIASKIETFNKLHPELKITLE